MNSLSAKAKNAIFISGISASSYLAVYITRNILGTFTPQITEKSIFTEAQIGLMSSLFFIVYAIGQLVNGIIGDKIKAKYMVGIGLAGAGIINLLFIAFSRLIYVEYALYGLSGYFLAMVYSPLIKLISENTEPKYAVRGCTAMSFACVFGSPLAGVLASFFYWKTAFAFCGILLCVFSAAAFIIMSYFEKKGSVKFLFGASSQKKEGAVKILIEHGIIKYTVVSFVTGIVRTTLIFWLPTYLTQQLKFTSKQSAMIFTASTLLISASAFFAMIVYNAFKRKLNLSICVMLALAAVSFALVCFMEIRVLNIVFMILGILSSNTAATILWNIYCPSMRDTGLVSTTSGFLDFVSYAAASLSSVMFAGAAENIGWAALMLIMSGFMLIGGTAVIIRKKKRI